MPYGRPTQNKRPCSKSSFVRAEELKKFKAGESSRWKRTVTTRAKTAQKVNRQHCFRLETKAKLAIHWDDSEYRPSKYTSKLMEDKVSHYYINRNSQDDGYHEVHDGDANCSHPPLPANRIYLGFYDTCADAIAAARRANPGLLIDGCYYCTNCHTR